MVGIASLIKGIRNLKKENENRFAVELHLEIDLKLKYSLGDSLFFFALIE